MNDNFVIAPNSTVKLLKVPIQIDEKNQLDFVSVTAQYNYFNGLSNSLEFENLTYIRKDSVLRIPALIDDIIEYNYVMYQNESFSNKWFYAFITDMKYSSSEMTEVRIKEDSFQTWMFDITYKNSFIEREHVTDDTIGANLIDEGLATGDYIVNSIDSTSTNEYAVVLATTINLYNFLKGTSMTAPAQFPIKKVGGVPSASYLMAFPLAKESSGTDEISGFNDVIGELAEAGKTDTITGVYVVPIDMLDMNTATASHPEQRWDALYYNYNDHKWYDTQQSLGGAWFCYLTSFKNYNSTITVTKPTQVNGYTPRNKKLLTSKYCYLLADNNGGASSKYAYELFSTTNCVFNIYGVPTPGCSYRILPQSYNSVTSNNLEGLTGAKLPIGSWDNDVYTNWLTQNGVNIAGHKLNATEAGYLGAGISSALALGGIIAGTALTGGAMLPALAIGGGGALLGSLSGIFDVMQEDYQHSIVPPQAEGNMNAGDVNFAIGTLKFSFYKMSIRQEVARSIDGFFDMFGYKVNKFKNIATHTRSNWNYIKTQECNLEGDIPQTSLQAIKDMFNRGITIWHSASHFLDYSQSNTILS